FRNHHNTTLDKPSQDYLGSGLVILFPNGDQQLIIEGIVFAFRKWSPGFMLDLVIFQKLVIVMALIKGMRFNLINDRYDLVVGDYVHYAVGMKICHTYRFNEPLLIQFLHRAP